MEAQDSQGSTVRTAYHQTGLREVLRLMLPKSAQETALERLGPVRVMDVQRQQIEQFLGLGGGEFIDHAVFPGSLHAPGKQGSFLFEGRERICQIFGTVI